MELQGAEMKLWLWPAWQRPGRGWKHGRCWWILFLPQGFLLHYDYITRYWLQGLCTWPLPISLALPPLSSLLSTFSHPSLLSVFLRLKALFHFLSICQVLLVFCSSPHGWLLIPQDSSLPGKAFLNPSLRQTPTLVFYLASCILYVPESASWALNCV